MAANNSAKTLLDELTCSVCTDYFKDPVCLDCGHNFCQACITECWRGLHTHFRCPECRKTFTQRTFKPNRHLRNIVEASRPLSLESTKEPEVERVCEKHKRALDVFCQEDQIPICMVCHLSRDHREHTVIPIDEAAEDYKAQVQSHLEILKKESSEILSFKSYGENKSQELLNQLQTERDKIVSEFQQLHKFLKEQEQLLLTQLDKLNKEIKERKDEYVAKLSEELSSLSSLINKIEQKHQQTAIDFLQGIKGTLSRCERRKFQNPVAFSSELKWSIWESSQKNEALETIMKKFKDTLSSRQQLHRADDRGDPDTAHPRIVVSADGTCVSLADKKQARPNNPERFDTELCLLGSAGFTSGRHYWEINIQERDFCAVGMARESVTRKGRISFNPEHGIWAVECRGNSYWALTSPEHGTPLFLRQAPTKVWAYLDYEVGKVAFFDAGHGDPIFTFPPASFSGERIRPLFRFGSRGPSLQF